MWVVANVYFLANFSFSLRFSMLVILSTLNLWHEFQITKTFTAKISAFFLTYFCWQTACYCLQQIFCVKIIKILLHKAVRIRSSWWNCCIPSVYFKENAILMNIVFIFCSDWTLVAVLCNLLSPVTWKFG